MKTIEPKDPQEIITASFGYADGLGAAVVNSAVITVTVVQGVDAAPANLLSGAAQMATPFVLQNLKDGVAGVRYKVKCLATLSDARKLSRSLLVDVKVL